MVGSLWLWNSLRLDGMALCKDIKELLDLVNDDGGCCVLVLICFRYPKIRSHYRNEFIFLTVGVGVVWRWMTKELCVDGWVYVRC